MLLLAIVGFALTRLGGGDDDDASSTEQVEGGATATTAASAPPLTATQLATPAPASAGGTFRGGPERSGLQPGPAPSAPHPAVDWFVRAGSSVTSSPAVAGGRAVVGDTDGTLHVYDAADGREIASFSTGAQIRSSPAVEDGVAYFGSDDGRVYAVDVESGNEIWSFDAGSPVSGSPAVVADTVYIGTEGGRALALDALRGLLVWSAEIDTELGASPAIADSVAYFAGTDGVLRAYDARTGAERWTFEADAGFRASPAVAHGVVYIGDQDGVLHSVNAETGAEVWTFATGGAISSSAAAVGGVVFVASANNYLYSVNAADGIERWRYRSGGPIESSPALVTGNEVRYVATLGAAETIPPKESDSTGSFTITLDPVNRSAFYTLFVPEIEEATIAHIHLGPPGVAGPAIVTLLDTTEPLSTIDTTSTFDGAVLAGPLAGDFDGLVQALEAGELYLNVHTVRNPSEEIRGQLVPDATGVVFVGSGDGQLHAIDAGRGVKLWSFQTGGAVTSSPAVLDGRIFFGSGDGHVYTLGEGG